MKRRSSLIKDLSGHKFGRLTVVKLSDRVTASGAAMWDCLCECGNNRVVPGHTLTSGKQASCGCLQKEKAATSCLLRSTHGHASRGRVSKTYKAWQLMKARVDNDPDYRGVYLCPEWRESFDAFLSHVGEMPECAERVTLDRIDNALGYRPRNVRWADDTTQANNKTNNRRITYQGQTKTLANWARDLDMPYKTLAQRFYLGWDVPEAFTTPIRDHSLYLTLKGERRLLTEWAAQLGIPSKVLRSRKSDLGWDDEKVLLYPYKPIRRKNESTNR